MAGRALRTAQCILWWVALRPDLPEAEGNAVLMMRSGSVHVSVRAGASCCMRFPGVVASLIQASGHSGVHVFFRFTCT